MYIFKRTDTPNSYRYGLVFKKDGKIFQEHPLKYKGEFIGTYEFKIKSSKFLLTLNGRNIDFLNYFTSLKLKNKASIRLGSYIFPLEIECL